MAGLGALEPSINVAQQDAVGIGGHGPQVAVAAVSADSSASIFLFDLYMELSRKGR